MWNLKNDTNEIIYKTEMANLWLPKGKRNKLGVWD